MSDHQLLLCSLLWLMTVVTAGCRLSDPGCASDAECRSGRVCQEGLCVGNPDGIENNGVENNGAENNGAENNGAGNNGAGNNGAGNNGAENNGSENNGAANNGVANNGVANNGIQATCLQDGCSDGLVCARAEDDEPECVEPWNCMIETEGGGDGCFYAFLCDEGPFLVECKHDPTIESTFCYCFGPEGEGTEFELPNACDSPDLLAREANIQCGFRVAFPSG